MHIRIYTGGELWALIDLPEEEAIRTAASCYAFARERWPHERTRISGVTDVVLAKIKKLATKMMASSTTEKGMVSDVKNARAG